jgi:hypothetical protein
LLERDLAQRAGAGFAGKHNTPINRQLGNWFFRRRYLRRWRSNPIRPRRTCVVPAGIAAARQALCAPFMNCRCILSTVRILNLFEDLRPAMATVFWLRRLFTGVSLEQVCAARS